MNLFNKIYKDFLQATNRLEYALAKISEDDLIQAGCIQYFEFCFELSWKTIKVAVENEGLTACLSPKACLKQAFALGWIQNEFIWLDMLEARNRMAHTYNAKSALGIYHQLPGFLVEFKNLGQNLVPYLKHGNL